MWTITPCPGEKAGTQEPHTEVWGRIARLYNRHWTSRRKGISEHESRICGECCSTQLCTWDLGFGSTSTRISLQHWLMHWKPKQQEHLVDLRLYTNFERNAWRFSVFSTIKKDITRYNAERTSNWGNEDRKPNPYATKGQVTHMGNWAPREVRISQFGCDNSNVYITAWSDQLRRRSASA